MNCVAVTYPEPLAIENVHDDLKRETAFYKQALYAATIAREMILKAKKPFSRPEGFFCEMIKSENHMQKIQKRKDEQTDARKRSEDAKKQRALKKFGKQVQIEKLQERQKEKTKELKKVDNLRKKHKIDNQEFDEDDFDIEIDAGEDEEKGKRGPSGTKKKREYKNSRYGYGGKKRHVKSNTKDSTDDMSSYRISKKPNKKPLRPGKSRRQKMRK